MNSPLDTKTVQKRLILIALLTVFAAPILLYPAYYLSMLFYDLSLGQQFILFEVLNGSRRQLWNHFWSDWRASLGFAYIATTPGLVGYLAYTYIRHKLVMPLLYGIAISSALLVTFFVLAGTNLTTSIATSILFVMPIHLFLRIVTHK